jgi:hypothetical protein
MMMMDHHHAMFNDDGLRSAMFNVVVSLILLPSNVNKDVSDTDQTECVGPCHLL